MLRKSTYLAVLTGLFGCGAVQPGISPSVDSDPSFTAEPGDSETSADPDAATQPAADPPPDPVDLVVTDELRDACRPLGDEQILSLVSSVEAASASGESIADGVDAVFGACDPIAWPSCEMCARAVEDLFVD